MDVLDIPRRLLSMLPFVGGSNEPDRPAPEAERTATIGEDETVDEQPPAAEAGDEFDDPDEDDDYDEDAEDDDEEDEPEAALPDDDEPDEVDDEPDDDDVDDEPDADESDDVDQAATTVDISGITAPSIGPNTVIEKTRPQDRLARSEQSSTDAMGLEKRRDVIGGSYSAGFGKQLARWAIVIAVIAGAGFGAKLLVDDLDKAPAKPADRAPWADNEQAPAPLE